MMPRQNRSSGKELLFYVFEIITCNTLIYTMDHPILTVSNLAENILV